MLNAVYMPPITFITGPSSFISESIKTCIYENFQEIKSKETLDDTDGLFIEVINDILRLKESIVGIDTQLNFETLKIKSDITFDGIQPIISKAMKLDLILVI